MFDGSIRLSNEIQPGDLLMSDDSTPAEVVSVSVVNEPLYELVPLNGNKLVLGESHQLSLKATNYEFITDDKLRQRYTVRWLTHHRTRVKTFLIRNYNSKEESYIAAKHFLEHDLPNISNRLGYKDTTDVSIKYFQTLTSDFRNNIKTYQVSIDFNEKDVSLDPYALGYWLGDGTTGDSGITTADQPIVEYFCTYAESLGLQFKKIGNTKYTYRITTGKPCKGKRLNNFLNLLTKYRVRYNKHIPDEYKYNSRDIRLKVLAGLIDSDGYYGGHCNYDLIFKLKQLAEDICFVSRSLGFKVTLNPCRKTCTNAKNGPVTGTYYRLHISGEGLENIPVLLERKKSDVRVTKKSAIMSGFKLNPIGKGDYYKIVTKDNKRYLFGDFTPTNGK